MAKPFSERPVWQKGLFVIGWSFVALVALSIVFGGDEGTGDDAAAGATKSDVAGESAGALFGEVQAITAGCNDSLQEIGEAMRAIEDMDDVEAVAASAEAGLAVCETARDELSALRDRQETDASRDAARTCYQSYFLVTRALEAAVGVDGEDPVGSMERAGSLLGSAQKLQASCLAKASAE